jgi:WD40 repeat protein
MAKDKKEPSVNIFQTMAQSGESQTTSQKLSELEELKQNAEAPTIPGFTLIKPIGQGAYAQVWEAIQTRTRRFVAVKVYHHQGGVNWLFLQREVERLLKLDKHPNIVSLLDADFTTVPAYYVMDLAQEGSLEKMIKNSTIEKITPAEVERIVDWMKEIGNALQYVHSKQMVHCDLKPANVLLDEEGHIRVADFGHSRVMTESGSALGTLFYMAPEQAILPDVDKPLQPNVRWDIYAYGCTAYALLGGHVAHADIGPALERTPIIQDRLKIYRNAIQNNQVPDLFTLTKGRVDRDLSAIVEKCMKSDPTQRYQTITEVLNDLKKRREGKPVSPLAHIPSYWLGKYARRYRVTLLVALLALIGLGLALTFAQQRQQSEVSNTAFNDILRGREFLDKDDQASAVVFFAESNKIYPTALARGGVDLNIPPIPIQAFPPDSGLKNAAFIPGGSSLFIAGENSGTSVWSLEGKTLSSFKNDETLKISTVSPSGAFLASGDAGGEVKVFSLKAVKKTAILKTNQTVTALAFSPDDKNLLVGGADGSVHLFNVATSQPQKSFMKTGSEIMKAVFNQDGKRVLTLNKDGFARVWDAENANPQGDAMTISLKGEPSWYSPDIAFAQEGKTVLVSDWSGSINFYSQDGHRQGKIYLDGTGAHFVVSPDNKEILTSSISQGLGQAKIWTIKGKRPSKFIFKHIGKILALGYSPNGKEVITAGTDRVARVWDSKTGKPFGHTLWHGDSVILAALNTNGTMALTGSKDGLIKLWDMSETDPNKIEIQWKKSGHAGLKNTQTKSLVSRDGKKVATYGGKSALLWETQTGKSLSGLMTHSGSVLNVLFSPDDTKLLTGSSDKEARLWDISSGQYKTLPAEGAVRTLAFSLDGSLMATGGDEKVVRLWKVSDATAQGDPIACGFKSSELSLSSNNKGLLVQSPAGALAYFSLPYKSGSKPVLQIEKGVSIAVLSPDSGLVAASVNGTVKLFSTSNGKAREKTLKQDHPITHLLFSPDHKTILTIGSNGEGQLWNLENGATIGSSLHHEGQAKQALFSPKGEGLAVIYADGGLQFWDAKTGEPIGIEVQPSSRTQALGFLSDGSALICLGKNGSLQSINTSWLNSAADPKRLILKAEVAGQSTLENHGSAEPLAANDWYKLWEQYERP